MVAFKVLEMKDKVPALGVWDGRGRSIRIKVSRGDLDKASVVLTYHARRHSEVDRMSLLRYDWVHTGYLQEQCPVRLIENCDWIPIAFKPFPGRADHAIRNKVATASP